MNAAPGSTVVVAQLVRITDRESDYLGRTTARLLAEQPDLVWVRSLPDDDDRSEMLDAFVSRYGRRKQSSDHDDISNVTPFRLPARV